MIAGREHPTRIAFPARLQRRLIAFGAQQRMSQFNGKAPLSNPWRTYEQIRARKPPSRQSPAELLHHIIVSEYAVPHSKQRTQLPINVQPIIAEKPGTAK
jgi:hypothetical protein